MSKNLEEPEAKDSKLKHLRTGDRSKVFQMLSLQLLSFVSTPVDISHAKKKHQLEVETEEQNISWTNLKVSLFPNSLTFGVASASASVPQLCCLVH